MLVPDVNAIQTNPERRNPPPVTHTDMLWLIGALLLSLGTRIPFFSLPMIHDEGGYAYAARGWLEGTGHLYDDLWISRPQGIFAVYALVFQTLGTSVLALRFTAWIAAALTVLAVWLFARRWTTPPIANVSTLLCALMLSWPTIEGFTANAEIFSGLPAAFAAWWLLRQEQTGWTVKGLIWIGVLAGLSTVLKPSGIVTLLIAWAFILWLHGPIRTKLARCGWIALGLGIVGAITLIHGYTLGWDRFIYATFTYRLTTQSSITVGILHHLRAIGWMIYNAAELFVLIFLVFMLRIRFPLRPYDSAVQRSFRSSLVRTNAWRRGIRRTPGGLLLLLWFVCSVIGIAIGGDWWTHYLVQAVPPIALWVGWNLFNLTRALHTWRRPVALMIAATLFLLPYAVIEDGAEGMLNRLYHHPGYPAQEAVAAYIHEHTEPGDTIYVAFDQASIYYLSDRQPAYRHLYDQELRGLPESYAEIIDTISGPDRPVYIVSTLHPGPFPDDSRAFWRVVGEYYELETTIDGVPIYRAKDVP